MSYFKAYLTDISILCNSEIFNSAYSLMSKERQKKIDGYKFEEGKLLSLGAGLMLRQACIDAGLDADEKTIVSPAGKPEFMNYSDVHFSISHSGKYALCMISDCNIGCDIQILEKPRLNIASRFFSEEENQQIEKCKNPQEKEAMFFKLWTLKESFVKALGTGIDDNFDKFSIICNQKISVKQNFNKKVYSFGNLDFDKGYCASYCIENAGSSDVSNYFYFTENSLRQSFYCNT